MKAQNLDLIAHLQQKKSKTNPESYESLMQTNLLCFLKRYTPPIISKQKNEAVMINKKLSKINLNYLFLLSTLISTHVFANIDQNPPNPSEPSRDAIAYSTGDESRPFRGKIVAGRYHAPKDIFSCRAYDFDEGSYTAQDSVHEHTIYIGFFNILSDFKEATITFMPELENQTLGKEELRKAFKDAGITFLKTVDKAQGIEILKEEMVEDNMFFAAVSVEKTPLVISPEGDYMASTRGYLIFQIKDKLVILINQRVTPPGHKHNPKWHIEKLKQDILEFRKTFEFSSIPYDFTTILDPS
jgi:hypothetical protein